MILELDANLSHYAGVIKKSLRIDVNRVPGWRRGRHGRSADGLPGR